MKFAKRKELRYFSHLDLLRMFEMILRRAEIPLVYSQGFHPRPRIHFGPPLPLGLTSETEWADFELVWDGSVEDLKDKLSRTCPPGFEILEMRLLEGPTQSLSHRYDLARYEIPMGRGLWDLLEVDRKLDAFFQKDEFWVEEKREDRVKRFDMRKAVRAFEKKSPTLFVTLSINDPAGHNTNPTVFLKEVLCLAAADAQALDIRRTELLSSQDLPQEPALAAAL